MTTTPTRCGVVDLRQYTLHPGARDTLIDLFDAHFVDGQEAVGMHIIGQFRDLDDPDLFVWLRGFDSMDARGEALPAFYYGPVWREQRSAANATMVDSDNALLLAPVLLSERYPVFGAPRGETEAHSVVEVTVLCRDRPVDEEYRDLVLDQAVPAATAAGAGVVGVFVTDPSENNFPALPLRQENVVTWISRFDDDDSYADYRSRLDADSTWREKVLPALLRAMTQPSQVLRLRPTVRSQLR